MTAQPSSAHRPPTGPRAVNALVVFAKAPVPGQVKTRLCPPLTSDEAATLHGSFVLDQLERTKAAITKFKLPVDRFVACSPSSAHVFFKILSARHNVGLLDQTGDDLGTRMEQVFADLFARGYQRIVLVGTDVPNLPLTHYRQAFDLLQQHDVVFGPAQDGGYYLLGLRKPVPQLFRGIPWSTDQVLARSDQQAAEAGVSRARVPVWRDVDTLDDLNILIDDAAADRKRPKGEQLFSSRTAGALELTGKRLRERRT
ncbi:MAG: TIGR04282 family arsenosugar biosynthesis glycosyltransferase [Nitrospiraceae bacterium]|nr:TIGR04282 family arsenosugar biosynthesis glycosyltransferase [Nitrospiraceae bacterium]